MPKITIEREKCKGCRLCIAFCPKGAIIPEEKLNQRGARPVKFKPGAECAGCTFCALICPDGCIEVYK